MSLRQQGIQTARNKKKKVTMNKIKFTAPPNAIRI